MIRGTVILVGNVICSILQYGEGQIGCDGEFYVSTGLDHCTEIFDKISFRCFWEGVF